MTQEDGQILDQSAHPQLSKSRVQYGHQCHLRLWNDCFARELATPANQVDQFRFARGTRVGELARQRFPGGKLIEAGYEHADRAVEATHEAMADVSIPALFEAAVVHENVAVRVDVLQRVDGEAWNLFEVKAASNAKEVYLRDVAIQLWVARGAGLPVRTAGLLLLNTEYVYEGGPLDLERLFKAVDLTHEATAMQGDIESLVGSLHEVLTLEEPPAVEPGDHCSDPYDCPYWAHCTEGYEFAENTIDDLPRLKARTRADLEDLGVGQIDEIPDDFPLAPLHARIRECVATGRDWVSQELAGKLLDITYPVHHLDFEAFGPAVPFFAGTQPFEAVPFLYSIHREYETGEVEHFEYLLADGAGDQAGGAHRALAERLLADLGEAGSICVYSSYEQTTIRKLAEHCEELRAPLEALLPRIWDLLPIIRHHYYHPEFRGSFSIKWVLPALVPHLSYDDLEVSGGQAASMMYEMALGLEDAAEREGVFAMLREYCARDSLAMLELRRALGERAESSATNGAS